jgi:phosphoribosylamine-glycine ligase
MENIPQENRVKKDKINILMVGSGVRENVFISKLHTSSLLGKLYCIPAGNNPAGGIRGSQAEYLTIHLGDHPGIIKFVEQNQIDIVFLSCPEVRKADLGDYLEAKNTKVLPTSVELQLISSTIAMRAFLHHYSIPIPSGYAFDNMDAVLAYCEKVSFPLVAKNNNPIFHRTAVCNSLSEMNDFLTEVFKKHTSRDEVEQVVIEKFLEGQKISIPLLVEGRNIMTLPYCYHMGESMPSPFCTAAYSSIFPVDRKTHRALEQLIVVPLAHALNYRIQNYRGIVTIEAIKTPKGMYMTELKMGLEPLIAQIIFSNLRSDFLELLWALLYENLDETSPSWSQDYMLGFFFNGQNQEIHEDIQTFCLQHRPISSSFHAFYGISDGLGKLELGITAGGKNISQAHETIHQYWSSANLPPSSFIIKNIEMLVKQCCAEKYLKVPKIS